MEEEKNEEEENEEEEEEEEEEQEEKGGRRGRVNPLLIFRVTLSTGSESPATGDFQTTASKEKKNAPAGNAPLHICVKRRLSICDRSTLSTMLYVGCMSTRITTLNRLS